MAVEASNQEQEEGEASAEDNATVEKKTGAFEMTKDESEAVLLSEDDLVDLLKKEEAEEEEAEKQEMGEEFDAGVDEEKFRLTEEVQEKKLFTMQDERVKNESVGSGEMFVKESKELEVEMKTKKNGDESLGEENVAFLEESEDSTESKILSTLDYAGDSAIVPPLRLIPAKDDIKSISTSATKEETYAGGAVDVQVMPNGKGTEHQGGSSKDQIQDNKPKDSQTQLAGKDEVKSNIESGDNASGKTRRPKKQQRTRKHSPQKEEKQNDQERRHKAPQEMGGGPNNSTVQKAKRRRAGQWVWHT